MRPVASIVVFSSFLLAPGLAAQSWNLDFQVGRMRSALDPGSPVAEQGVLGLRFERANTAFRLATGGPVSLERPIWGAIAVSQRLAARRRGLIAGLDVSGNGFLAQTGEPQAGVPGLLDPGQATAAPGGHALAGQALSLLGFEGQRFRVLARAGLSYYRGEFGSETRTRAVRLGEIQLWFQPVRAFALAPAVRHFETGDERSTFAGATVALSQGRLGLWGTLGEWVTGPDGTPLSWTAGGSLRILSRLTVTVAARREPFDPVYVAPAQTSWSAGISIPLGRTWETARAPVPARYTGGVAMIRLPASAAPGVETLSIAGDFNGWKAAPMKRRGNAWVFTVALPPGMYSYAFVDSSGKWFVPQNVPGRRDDGMGGHVAVLVVERPE